MFASVGEAGQLALSASCSASGATVCNLNLLLTADYAPFVDNLCVEISNLRNCNHEKSCANELQNIEDDAMGLVWEEASTCPHLRAWIAHFAHIDEESCNRKHQTGYSCYGHVVHRAKDLPMSAGSSGFSF